MTNFISKEQTDLEDDMPAEYDTETLRAMLKNGVRGKYAGRLTRQGNTAILAPDVSAAYPTDKEVNDALRSLMPRNEKTFAKNPV